MNTFKLFLYGLFVRFIYTVDTRENTESMYKRENSQYSVSESGQAIAVWIIILAFIACALWIISGSDSTNEMVIALCKVQNACK